VVVRPTLPTLFSITIRYITMSEAVSIRAVRIVSKRLVGRKDVSLSKLSQLSHTDYEAAQNRAQYILLLSVET